MLYGIIGVIICHIILTVIDIILDIYGYNKLGLKHKIRVGDLFFIIIELGTICTLIYIYR